MSSKSPAGSFISGKIRFKGRMAMISIAVSFFIIILSLAISSGFRHEIREGVSQISGDVQLSSVGSDLLSGSESISSKPSYLDRISKLKGVKSIEPVVYRAGIVRKDGSIQGVLFKGMGSDSTTLSADIPSRLARKLNLSLGDRMQTYFISDKVKARNFEVTGIHDSVIDTDENIVVKVSLQDLQRVNGWSTDEVSALEIMLEDNFRSSTGMKRMAAEIGSTALMFAQEDEDTLVAGSAADRYASMFDWLQLIDTNVLAILALMIIVAGFNMISGLLILLFQNIRTIGILKSMGMTDRGISGVFLRVAARNAGIGLIIGNICAILLCLIQSCTHLVRLNPENYFVSYVPVSLNPATILMTDAAAFTAIMLLMLLPCLFISKVDPADTIRVS